MHEGGLRTELKKDCLGFYRGLINLLVFIRKFFLGLGVDVLIVSIDSINDKGEYHHDIVIVPHV